MCKKEFIDYKNYLIIDLQVHTFSIPCFKCQLTSTLIPGNKTNTFVLGLQIRVGGHGDASVMRPEELQVAIDCAKRIASVWFLKRP